MSLLTLFEGDSFHPRRLFIGSTAGAIYDYDDYAYLYQKSDGSVPVTALEQPVGLMLDKRYGGARGSELKNTGTTGLVGTATAATYNTTTGAGSVTRVDSNNQSYVLFSDLTVGGWYAVNVTCTSGVIAVRAGTYSSTEAVTLAAGSARTFFRRADAGGYISITNTPSAGSATFTISSIRELPGLHAYQSTDAARPVLKGTPRYTLFDRTDDHLLLATGGGSTTGFMLAGSIQPASAGTARTIFSDRGTNTGYKVEIDASNNLLFTAGNGTAFTTCTGPTLTAGTNYAFCVWHDGTNLNIKVGTAAVVQQAFATATAGTSTVTLFKDNAAASGYFSGRLYALTYIRNASGINDGIASQLIGWSAAKGGFAP